MDARVGDVQDDAVAGRAGGAVRGGGDVGDEDVGEGVDLGLGGGAAADGDGGASPGEAKQLEGRGGEGRGGEWAGGTVVVLHVPVVFVSTRDSVVRGMGRVALTSRGCRAC